MENIERKFNFLPFLRSINRIFNAKLFISTYGYIYFQNFFRRKKERKKERIRRRRGGGGDRFQELKFLIRTIFYDERGDKSKNDGNVIGHFRSRGGRSTTRLSDKPTRYHPAAHYDRRDRGVPRVEGARFSCGSRSFRGKVGTEKGAREQHARRGGPLGWRVERRGGRAEKCRK